MKPQSLPPLSMTVSRNCWASKPAMGEVNEKNASPFGSKPTGGRYLLGAICVIALILLALIGDQTTPGSTGQTEMSGGWWAEPALAPAVALVITILSAGAAWFAAKRETIQLSSTLKTYTKIGLIAGCMISTVLLMKIVGFALSVFLFASVVGRVGGFRGWRLALLAASATVAMVVVFRIGFRIWFPRPELYKWLDLPFWLQGIL